MRFWRISYILFFFCICLLPTMGMFVQSSVKEEQNAQNQVLTEFPQIVSDGKMNFSFIGEAGQWYMDHFGFRDFLVTANASLVSKMFGVSSVSGVIDGTDGWLYYKDSLRDFLGYEQMSDRAVFCVAHSLRIVQQYLEKRNISFLFVPVPNKNTLYPEHMPYYDSLKAGGDRNYDRLADCLEQEEVHWSPVKSLLKGYNEVLYHKRDSHWNNLGAALVAEEILKELNHTAALWSDGAYETRADFIGDLDRMLFPIAPTMEEEYYFLRQQVYAYIGDVKSTFDYQIRTVAPSRVGNLVMYRDSFSNALVPFLADDFHDAFFTRGEPFRIIDIDLMQTSDIVIERAERFIPALAETAPVMSADPVLPTEDPKVLAALTKTLAKETDIEQTNSRDALPLQEKDIFVTEMISEAEGAYFQKITGKIRPGVLEPKSRIFLCLDGVFFEAFPTVHEAKDAVGEEDGFSICIASTYLKEAGSQIGVYAASNEYVKFLGTIEMEFDNCGDYITD